MEDKEIQVWEIVDGEAREKWDDIYARMTAAHDAQHKLAEETGMKVVRRGITPMGIAGDGIPPAGYKRSKQHPDIDGLPLYIPDGRTKLGKAIQSRLNSMRGPTSSDVTDTFLGQDFIMGGAVPGGTGCYLCYAGIQTIGDRIFIYADKSDQWEPLPSLKPISRSEYYALLDAEKVATN